MFRLRKIGTNIPITLTRRNNIGQFSKHLGDLWLEYTYSEYFLYNIQKPLKQFLYKFFQLNQFEHVDIEYSADKYQVYNILLDDDNIWDEIVVKRFGFYLLKSNVCIYIYDCQNFVLAC